MTDIAEKAKAFCKAVEDAESEGDAAILVPEALLLAAISGGQFTPDQGDWTALERAARALERRRWFRRVRSLVDAIGAAHPPTTRLRRHYAQALIEQAEFAPAIAILSDNLRDVPDSDEEHSEALGLLGRTFKQIYVNGTSEGPLDVSTRAAFCQALDFYRRGYMLNRDSMSLFAFQKTSWLGTNYAALARRAQDLQLQAADEWRNIARDVLDRIENKFNENDSLSAWDYASAGELALILNEVNQSREWFERYAALVKKDGFALNSTLRQLREVWKLTPDDTAQGRVVADLMRRAVLVEHAPIEITPEAAETFPKMQAGDLERSKILLAENAPHTPRSIALEDSHWEESGPLPSWMLEHVLELAWNNTVRITNLDGAPAGTGFVIEGKQIKPEATWASQTVLVTCAHVVSQHGSRTAGSTPPLHPLAARAVRMNGTSHELREVVWEGAPGRFDVSIVRFADAFAVQPPPLVPCDCPVKDFDYMRIFLIGYPAGRNLSLSYHPENERVGVDHQTDGDTVRIRYYIENAPGYSGSPLLVVRRGGISVAGVHAEGRVRETGAFGRRQLPEGEAIWFPSVLGAVRRI